MATIAHVLWLVAEWALFSCNDRALWNFFFNVKFALDLGVIKTKTVSFSKELFLLSLLVSNAQPGFSLFSEHDLKWPLVCTNGCWKMLQYIKASVWNCPVMTSLSVNKWYVRTRRMWNSLNRKISASKLVANLTQSWTFIPLVLIISELLPKKVLRVNKKLIKSKANPGLKWRQNMLRCSPFAHARYGSQMIDRFLYWGNHRNQKSGEIKGSCQAPLVLTIFLQGLDQ